MSDEEDSFAHDCMSLVDNSLAGALYGTGGP
jgi:hypothetical protein